MLFCMLLHTNNFPHAPYISKGKVAWEIYQRFEPKSVLGIDIDDQLIVAAQEKLKCASQRDGIDHHEKVAFR